MGITHPLLCLYQPESLPISTENPPQVMFAYGSIELRNKGRQVNTFESISVELFCQASLRTGEIHLSDFLILGLHSLQSVL